MKKLISIILALVITIGQITALQVFASEPNIIMVNEVFDDYATNSIPNGMKISGMNARVISAQKYGKALYGKVWGSPVDMIIPISNVQNQTIYQFDLKIDGDKISGGALNIAGSTKLIRFSEEGNLVIDDGRIIGSYIDGKWHRYTVLLDYSTLRYSLLIDGKTKLRNHNFKTSPSKPKNLNFSFANIDSKSITEVYLDNVRAYGGEKVLDDEDFPQKASNNEILEYEEQTEPKKYNTTFINASGRMGYGSISFFPKNGVAQFDPSTKGDTDRIHFVSTTQDVYANLSLGIPEDTPIVLEIDVFAPLISNNAAFVRFYDSISGAYSNLFRINALGDLLTGGGTTITGIGLNRWVTIAVAYNPVGGTQNVYVNGKLVSKGMAVHNGGSNASMLRMGFETPWGVGQSEIFFDNLKIYDGFEPREIESAKQPTLTGKYAYAGESEAQAKGLLGTDTLFMTNCNYYFANGEKKTYPEGKASYADENGVAYVASELLAKALGTDITISGDIIKAGGKSIKIGEKQIGIAYLDGAIIKKDNTVYLPVASFTQKVLGKYAYNDDRGFCIVSPRQGNWSNSLSSSDVLEPIDVVYRYMQYERPSAEQLVKDIAATNGSEHPRIFMRKADIPKFREAIENSDYMKEQLKITLASCESYLNIAPVAYTFTQGEGVRLFNACMSVRTRMIDLGVGYLATGKKAYLDRMWVELENALGWEHWNTQNSFLDSGNIGPGIAFAYDLLYDSLTDEQKAFCQERIQKLYLDYAVGVYNGESAVNIADYRLTNSNWGAVCGTSMFLTALAFINDGEEGSDINEKARFVAENSLKGLEYSVGQLHPDGAIKEGLGYWGYYIEHMGWTINALLNACGTDYGFLASPGYKDAVRYGISMQTSYGSYNYNETNGTSTSAMLPELFAIAGFYNDNSAMEAVRENSENIGKNGGSRTLLFYRPSKSQSSDYPLDNFFKGDRIVSMRSGYNADASYMAAIGGQIYRESQFDKGSFIYENGGVRWFHDMGAENKSVEGGFYYEDGYTLYRKRTEGHNSVVINPSKDKYDPSAEVTATDIDAPYYPGQTYMGIANVTRFESKSKGAIAVYDLADVYREQVTSYNRGFYMGNDRHTLVVQDEINLVRPQNDIYSYLHTRGNITIENGGKSAIVEQDGKKLKVEVICDAADWHLEKWEAQPMDRTMLRASGEYDRSKYSKIALIAKAGSEINISYRFSLLDGNSYEDFKFTAINSWSIPDGEIQKDPALDSIIYEGAILDGFNPMVSSYTITRNNDEALPVISATSPDGTVEIKQVENFTDDAIITVTGPTGRKVQYTVHFNYVIRIDENLTSAKIKVGLPSNTSFVEIDKVSCTAMPEADNKDIHAIDGDLTTRWTSTNDESLILDLGESKDFAGIALAFNFGSSRNYVFDILVSDDGVHYTRIYKGTSSGKTDEWEYLETPLKARFVRFDGHGHTQGEWNNLLEFRPYTKGGR